MTRFKRTFISICVASYNYADYLPRGFEAIRKQKYKDFEVVYLDDASSDNSVDLIQQFIQDNPDIRISLKVHSDNKGLLQTKTELLKLATGKYIMLCDADDWMADDCLQTLAARAESSDADRVISQVFDINEKNKILQIQDFASAPSKWLWNLHHGCLYKKEIIDKYDLKIRLYPDDVYLSTLVNCHCDKVEWVSEPLYYWLVHDNSVGRGKKENDAGIVDSFRKMTLFIKNTWEKVPEIKDKNEIRLLLIKLYYLQLFHELKRCSLPQKLSLYLQIRSLMRSVYPDYLNNCYLRQKDEWPARNYAMHVMRLGSFLERVHLMRIALIGYHILCRWFEFDQ